MCDSMPFKREKYRRHDELASKRTDCAQGTAGPSVRARSERIQFPYLIPVEDMEESKFLPRVTTNSGAEPSKQAAPQASYLMPLEEMYESDCPPCVTTVPGTKPCKQTAMLSSPEDQGESHVQLLLSSIPTAARGKLFTRVAPDVDSVPGDHLSRPTFDVQAVNPSDRFKLPEAITLAADVARQAALECSSAWRAMLRDKLEDLVCTEHKLENLVGKDTSYIRLDHPGQLSSSSSSCHDHGAAGYLEENRAYDKPGGSSEQQVSAGDGSSRTTSVGTQSLETAHDEEVADADMSTWVMEPPQGACSWDWPLSRAEAKERVILCGQFELMAEVEELRRRVSNGTDKLVSLES